MNSVKFSNEWFSDYKKSDLWIAEWLSNFYGNGYINKENQSNGIVLWHTERVEEIFPVGITSLIADDKNGYKFYFQYHPEYLDNKDLPAISTNYPKRKEPYIENSSNELSPFFDNLISEGWLANVQEEALGTNLTGNELSDYKKINGVLNRYNRLMMFGRECHGAVSVVYAKNDPEFAKSADDLYNRALETRSTITGAQPKTFGIYDAKGHVITAHRNQTSNSLVKLANPAFPGIVKNEYMCIKAMEVFNPEDNIVGARLVREDVFGKHTSISIKRFDRNRPGGRIHFEEAAQILGYQSENIREGSIKEVASIVDRISCDEAAKQILKEKLFRRVASQVLLGNLDLHMKNFGFFVEDGKVTGLTPVYDITSNSDYDENKEVCYTAFKVDKVKALYKKINARFFFNVGQDIGLDNNKIASVLLDLLSKVKDVKAAIMDIDKEYLDKDGESNYFISEKTRNTFCKKLEGRASFMLSGINKFVSLYKIDVVGETAKKTFP